MKKSLIGLLLCAAVIVAAVFRINYSTSRELQKLTSPDGKIIAKISEKSGDLIVETNKTNLLTIDYENRGDYGMSAFSADSRYLFVAVEKTGIGYMECHDFAENKSFPIQLQSLIRTSDKFMTLADEYDITEVKDATVTVIDINEHNHANLSYSFNDQNGKKYSFMVFVDLYNQKVDIVK